MILCTGVSYASNTPPLTSNEISFSGAVPYVNKSGSTQVPLRTLAEEMGYFVAWDGKTSAIYLIEIEDGAAKAFAAKYAAGSNQVSLIEIEGTDLAAQGDFESFMAKATKTVDLGTFTMNGEAEIVDGNVFVPVSSFATAFGHKTDWDTSTKVVTIIAEDESYAFYAGNKSPLETYIGMVGGGYYFTQDSIPRGGCVLTCLSMISSNINKREVLPTETYALNGYTVYYNWSRLEPQINITNTMRVSVSGQSLEQKKAQIISALEQYPTGTMLSFISANGTHHSVVASGYDSTTQTLYVNDPRYGNHVPLSQAWTGDRMITGSCDDLEYLVKIQTYQ